MAAARMRSGTRMARMQEGNAAREGVSASRRERLEGTENDR
jgi:hypothetical protein